MKDHSDANSAPFIPIETIAELEVEMKKILEGLEKNDGTIVDEEPERKPVSIN